MRAFCNMLDEVCERGGQPKMPCLEAQAHVDDNVLLLDVGQCITLEVWDVLQQD